MTNAVQNEIPRRALTVDEFCELYRIGKSTLYSEVRLGHLRLRKLGKRSLIATDDAEHWFGRLRIVQPALPKIELSLEDGFNVAK